MKFINGKIRVLSLDHGVEAQNALLSLGYRWRYKGDKSLDIGRHSLVFNNAGELGALTSGQFLASDNTEYMLDSLILTQYEIY
jgi:hypothetical protein